MENNLLDEKTELSGNLKLDESSVKYLKEGRGWAMFLAILAFIGVAFMIIAAIIMVAAGSMMGSQLGVPTGLISLIYIVMAIAMIFPPIYLFRFAQSAGIACNQNDSAALNEAIKNLRNNLKIKGILYIALIALYIVIIIVAAIVGISSAF